MAQHEGLPGSKKGIDYSYIPDGAFIEYVDRDDVFIQMAREYAQRYSLDKVMPNSSVIVRNGEVISIGTNGSTYHETDGCERVRLGSKSGEDYDLCEGYHPKNHSEQSAILDARTNGIEDLEGAEIYLWGHWWCCESCWEVMQANGINTVKMLEGSDVLFNRGHPNNIVGRQFEDTL